MPGLAEKTGKNGTPESSLETARKRGANSVGQRRARTYSIAAQN
jgi:hypothetical protein